MASLAAAAAALVVLTLLVARDLRNEQLASIQRRLRDQSTLIAELLSHRLELVALPVIDREADQLAHLVNGRVTLIGHDGVVLGDSDLDEAAVRSLENHLERPEIREARERGLGLIQRYSTTEQRDMLYTAVPTQHPVI